MRKIEIIPNAIFVREDNMLIVGTHAWAEFEKSVNDIHHSKSDFHRTNKLEWFSENLFSATDADDLFGLFCCLKLVTQIGCDNPKKKTRTINCQAEPIENTSSSIDTNVCHCRALL